MNIFLFVLCLVINGGIHKVHGIQNTLKEDLELERQQQLINKPHIKSIRVFPNLVIFHRMFFFFFLS